MNGEGYLVPSGAPGPASDIQFRQGAVSVRQFGRLMREARSHHVLAILDSCFSGTVFTNVRSALPAPVANMSRLPVRQMITSGRAGEQVADNGRFRELVIEALSGRRRPADPDKDGHIFGTNLGQFLFEQVSKETGGRQNPQFGKLDDPDYNQGDFVFRVLPLGVALRPSPPRQPVAIDTRPPSYIDQLIKTLEREAIAIHARLGTPGLLGLLVVLGFLWRWRANARLLERLQPGTRGMAEETQAIEQAALRATGYRERLQSWLDWLSSKLGSAHPWGPGAYERMLTLAVIYPIFGVLVVWVVTGENTSGIPGLLSDIAAAQRWLILALLVFAGITYCRSSRSEGWTRMVWSIVGVVALTALIAAIGSAVAIAFALVVAGSAATAVARKVASAVAFAVAVGFAGVSSDVDAKPFCGAAVVIMTVYYAIETVTSRTQPSIGHVVTWITLVTAVVAAGVMLPYGPLDQLHSVVLASGLVLLAALPLVNAVFDWLSLGLTRYLLGRTARGAQPLLNGALDIAGAAIILFALAIATTAALQGLNTLAFASGSDRPLIDLPFILETLRERPGDPAVW